MPAAVHLRPAAAEDQATLVAMIRAERLNPLDLKWPNFMVAVDEATGGIVAIGQVKGHRDGSRELASLTTLPAYRGQGLASRLVWHFLAQERGPLFLTCLDHLGPFYERFGFREIGEAEMTPFFRRLRKAASALHFLSSGQRRLLVMRYFGPGETAADPTP
jgi:predicted N-acetyltransferase YhbS